MLKPEKGEFKRWFVKFRGGDSIIMHPDVRPSILIEFTCE